MNTSYSKALMFFFFSVILTTFFNKKISAQMISDNPNNYKFINYKKWVYDLTWLSINIFYELKSDSIQIKRVSVKQLGINFYEMDKEFGFVNIMNRGESAYFESYSLLNSQYGFNDDFEIIVKGKIDLTSEELEKIEISYEDFYD